MALFAARMKRVDMVVLARDVRRVTTALGRLGVMELLEVKADESGLALTRVDRSAELERARALLARLDVLTEKFGLTAMPLAAADLPESVDQVEQEIVALEARVNPLLQERMKIESEAEGLQEDLARLNALRMFPARIEQVADAPFLYFAVGVMKADEFERLRASVRPDVILMDDPLGPDRRRVVAVTVRRGRFALETELKQHGFVREELALAPKGRPDEIVPAHEKRLDAIRAEQARLSAEIRKVADDGAARLTPCYRRLRLEVALIEASLHFGYTQNTSVISGWLPADTLAGVSEATLRETQGRVILQVRDADSLGVNEESIPTHLKNARWLRPFEVLVTGFGIPRYHEIEPTLLMAVTFLVLYGIMFGDIGHGLLLAILGFVLRRRTTGAIRDIMTVAGYAGVAATLGGFLYGSIFGFEELPALWIKPMHSTMTILAVPVAFGVLLISAGVVLNIINKFRAGHYLHGTIDRFGLLGLCFYWGALGLAVATGLGRNVPAWLVIVVLGLPLAVLFARDLVTHALGRGDHSEGYAAATINGGVEVMESITTYLANTFSFARVGAFALAHAGLSLATFALMDLVRGVPGGVVWSAIIFLLGTALIVLLEGLIVFVQCLRLQYYEFFGKFFDGSGRRYKPFRIA